MRAERVIQDRDLLFGVTQDRVLLFGVIQDRVLPSEPSWEVNHGLA